jgi:hypothetical protein
MVGDDRIQVFEVAAEVGVVGDPHALPLLAVHVESDLQGGGHEVAHQHELDRMVGEGSAWVSDRRSALERPLVTRGAVSDGGPAGFAPTSRVG